MNRCSSLGGAGFKPAPLLFVAGLALLAGCTTVGTPPLAERTGRPEARPLDPVLEHRPIEEGDVTVEPEGLTVESSSLLWLYTVTHSRAYTVRKVTFPSENGEETATAHLMVPDGDGPHPTLIVFPILAGRHVVSELLAKALVSNGFAVARLERRPLEFETEERHEVLAERFSGSIRDARRLIDWLVTQPDIDAERIGAAGVSLGGILSCLLQEVDDRVRAGFFLLSGGGLAETVYDSAEVPIRQFRDRMSAKWGHPSREDFVAWMRSFTLGVDPLTYAGRVEPTSVLLISGRFDQVMPRERTHALWEALGYPNWMQVPVGHYQGFAFLWWAVGHGADHLHRELQK